MESQKSNIVFNTVDGKCVVTVPQDVTRKDLQFLFERLSDDVKGAKKFIFDLSGVLLMDDIEFMVLQSHIKQHLVIGHKAAFCGVRPEMAAFLAFVETIDDNIRWYADLEVALNEI